MAGNAGEQPPPAGESYAGLRGWAVPHHRGLVTACWGNSGSAPSEGADRIDGPIVNAHTEALPDLCPPPRWARNCER